MRGKRFIRIKLTGARVALDRGVELPGIESFEPGAKPRELTGGKLLNGFFDVFGGGHDRNIAFAVSKRSPDERSEIRGVSHDPRISRRSCGYLLLEVFGTFRTDFCGTRIGLIPYFCDWEPPAALHCHDTEREA